MSKRRAPWAPAPWDWAGQCQEVCARYVHHLFGTPLAIQSKGMVIMGDCAVTPASSPVFGGNSPEAIADLEDFDG